LTKRISLRDGSALLLKGPFARTFEAPSTLRMTFQKESEELPSELFELGVASLTFPDVVSDSLPTFFKASS